MRKQLNYLISCQSEFNHLFFRITALVELENLLDEFNLKFS